ncbi:hypothetical protein RRV45_06960 [Bacillus sp. DTU_2020_1000418_1_SI_GHA_SEK_038]|uniref:hypothetical protein n=1 Tax=Bacillus sp. DTU_2020_1000418_1_SI_GHA_SEK_038 TaxID=3077585 RepID=UPI0028ED3D01|nr:hypothetical protein [Bacillus sp. DTU_2020_1000418_1_SI_GHA_SEK_038]WNS76721.1 hypothetical protein RRV45_06960 [Bacillus sp. DTU_2020_1000418_1_SI_GHA_SEK_038]
MFSQYFGHYLLNNGLLTTEQLKHALEQQKSIHVKLGVIAVDKGFLTSAQVEEIHDSQKKQDKRFGEIAVDLGFLTNEQVEQMLAAQKNNHLLLAQAIVDNNFMTIDEFSNSLNEYKKLYTLSDERFEAIKNGDIDAMVKSLLHSSENEKDDYIDYISLFVKNMIRFIDDQVYIEVSPVNGEIETDWLVMQEIQGEVPLLTALAASEEVFLHIASIYAEEELAEVCELAQASVSEFLNLHNGIFLVNMSNRGIELGMAPQSVQSEAVFQFDEDTSLHLTVHTSKGEFQLVISKKPQLAKVSAKIQETPATM